MQEGSLYGETMRMERCYVRGEPGKLTVEMETEGNGNKV